MVLRNMKELIRLSFKSIYVLLKFGPRVFLRYATEYMQNKRIGVKDKVDRSFVDVLFINGCYLGAPSRYRVYHPKEQLLAYNVTSNTIFYTEVNNDMLKFYRVIIIYRCPYTPELESFVIEAKKHNKTVIYDIDDLVIDKSYTDDIKYLSTMKDDERKAYDDGVMRMGKMLRLCDYCITTTEALAGELKKIVPSVFINRNVVSDEMMKLSKQAVYNRDILPFLINHNESQLGKGEKENYKKYKDISDKRLKSGCVRIGYFSGSITHNSDFELIVPAIIAVLEKYNNVELHIVGELEIPPELSLYRNRIVAHDFVDWTKLPELIASCDVNIAPLEDTLFNRAKSEIKWIEAAIVKVPTIASRVGAFEEVIEDGVTGLLCTEDEWLRAFEEMVEKPNLRKYIAENAYNYCLKYCYTITSGFAVAKYIRSIQKPNIAFVLPGLKMSGGVLVALKHMSILKKAGFDVFIISDGWESDETINYNGDEYYVINNHNSRYFGRIDKVVATLFTTVSHLTNACFGQRYYLVQNYETDFNDFGDYNRLRTQQTYTMPFPMKYITISRWCQDWLKNDFNVDAAYAPNGIDTGHYKSHRRNFDSTRKVVILIEGDCESYYKGVDESFTIANKLDPSRFEVWYMSYTESKKDWYKIDKEFHKIPNMEVHLIYEAADILLKSSWLESFSYPPLEMMATGGYAVVARNGGNVEYLEDHKNALLYEKGDIDAAVSAIYEICSDSELREKLYKNGLETAIGRDWNNFEQEILSLYDV